MAKDDHDQPRVRDPVQADDDYVLQRDYAAATRLNCQFLLWKSELGFNLHPHIPEPSPSARIADVATGTAIWLLELARAFPGRQFDGFDISLEQCPPPEWLPPKVRLQQWDMFGRLSPELEGAFDVVHIRLLLLVIRENDPGPLLRNVMKMLKPGGHLQWDELDPFSAYVVSRDPSADVKSIQRKQELTDFTRLQWVPHLHQALKENGFIDVNENTYECDLSLAKFYQDSFLMMMEEMAARTENKAEKQKVIDAIRSTQRETGKGRAARCTPKKVFVAQKPPT